VGFCGQGRRTVATYLASKTVRSEAAVRRSSASCRVNSSVSLLMDMSLASISPWKYLRSDGGG
jgi:diaminopimelate epimerase